MSNFNKLNSELEKKPESPGEMRDVLVNLDEEIDRLSQLNDSLYQKLVARFAQFHKKIEEWREKARRGDLDDEQRAIFDQANEYFLDLAADLVRYDRWTGDEEGKGLITFGLDNYPGEKRGDGHHSFDSPLLGIHASTLEQYSAFAMKKPAFLRFGSALYFNDAKASTPPGFSLPSTPIVLMMIPEEQKAKADAIARDIYLRYCKEHAVSPEAILDITDDDTRPGVTYTYDVENLWNTWEVHVVVFSGGNIIHDGDHSFYVPSSLLAIHEIGHLERIRPFQKDTLYSEAETSIREIAQVIDGIILQDYVYKMINGISMDEVVEYPYKIPTSKGDGVSLGLIANLFRKLKTKYGTIEKALMSPEGQKFVSEYYDDSPLPSEYFKRLQPPGEGPGLRPPVPNRR